MVRGSSSSASLLVLTAMLAAACTDGPGSKETFERKNMLINTTDAVIIPSYEALASSTDAFGAEVDALCAAPDLALLQSTRAAWKVMRRDWKRTEAFRFGPVEQLQTVAALDTWPSAFVFMEGTLNGSASLDAAGVAALSPTQRGQPAAEYLLWGRNTDDATVLSGLGTAGAPTRRCQYLRGLALDLRTNTRAVLDAWRTGYRTDFVDAGGGDPPYPTLKAAVDQMVNQLVATSESVAGARLAAPLGLRGDGVPAPNAVESPYSANAIQDMLDINQGVENLYRGSLGTPDGLSLSDYVREKDPAVDAQVLTEIAELNDALEAIPGPLQTALTENTALVEAAYQQSRDVKRVFATNVVALLGVTLTFNDNDGD